MPEDLTTLDIPDINDVTLDHTLRQFFLAALIDIERASKTAIEAAFAVGGNVFRCRLELLRIICVAPPATEENKQ